MKTVFQWVERIAPYVLRISLGLVLLWIGALHLQNPHPIVVLLSLSLPFLASSAFVYVLGALEVIAGVLLIAGLWVRYVGLATLVLFAGHADHLRDCPSRNRLSHSHLDWPVPAEGCGAGIRCHQRGGNGCSQTCSETGRGGTEV